MGRFIVWRHFMDGRLERSDWTGEEALLRRGAYFPDPVESDWIVTKPPHVVAEEPLGVRRRADQVADPRAVAAGAARTSLRRPMLLRWRGRFEASSRTVAEAELWPAPTRGRAPTLAQGELRQDYGVSYRMAGLASGSEASSGL